MGRRVLSKAGWIRVVVAVQALFTAIRLDRGSKAMRGGLDEASLASVSQRISDLPGAWRSGRPRWLPVRFQQFC
jgi:hypothetical protein